MLIMSYGLILAVAGAAVAAVLSGFGSAYGVRLGGQAAAGVVSENPELFGKLLVIQALPSTQGLYGFIIAIIVMIKVGMFGEPLAVSTEAGWQIFAACMPVAIVGLVSAINQGQTAVSAIHMVAKQPDSSGRGITMTALVETFAILAFLVSILFILIGIQL
jgi:V/A-type H+-transporting ATPase subunit K